MIDLTALKEQPKKLYIIILAAVFGLISVILCGIFIYRAMDPYDNRMMDGVTIGGMEVGGMTKKEATEALQNALSESLYKQPLTVQLPEKQLQLSPADTGVSVDVKTAIKDAYRIGRDDTEESTKQEALALRPYLTFNEEYIRGQLSDYAAAYDTTHTPFRYEMTGSMPALDVESYDKNAACQTLSLTLGLPTVILDTEDTYNRILTCFDESISACQKGSYQLTVEITPEVIPEKPDLEAIYQEFYVAPVDDSLSMETYQMVPGSYGYYFDLEAAQDLLNSAEYGETIQIPMAYIEPEILGDEVYFRDVLGSCDTKHTNNENRNTNLKLLCAALDGLVLQPGEEFSYNETVGERTAERGYLPAPAYSGNRLANAVGGGVCQGSTTLYNCVLLADLEVITRLCHGATVSYVPLGLDAAVNWGTTDFQFRNSFHFPIKIQAEVSDGYVKMKILGTDEKDYYIVMTTSRSETDKIISVASYKNKYDKETNQLISRDWTSFSNYYKNIG